MAPFSPSTVVRSVHLIVSSAGRFDDERLSASINFLDTADDSVLKSSAGCGNRGDTYQSQGDSENEYGRLGHLAYLAFRLTILR